MRISYGILILVGLSTQMQAQVQGGSNGGGLGGFGGPAVMGRGAGSGIGQRGGADMGIGYFAGVMGTYDNGLTAYSLNSNGDVGSLSGFGVEGYAGVYGSKRLRRGSFGINYTGRYRNYPSQSNFNGIDQNMGLYTSRQLTKRSMLSFNANGGTTNRPFGMPYFGTSIDPGAIGINSPTSEVFDNRIYYAGGGLQYVLQKSARLSYSIGGNGFLTRRTGGQLFGVTGAGSNADVAYRISRRQTISIGYQFFFYNYTRNFGDSYAHGGYFGYSSQLSKRVQFALQAGAIRLESLGLRSSQLDPVIAALIGVSTVQEVYYGISYLPTGTASLTFRANRLHSFSANASLMVTPGNGVINTSRTEMAGASYTYSGIRNLGVSVSSYYNSMSSLVGDHQSFNSMQTSVGLSSRINSQVFASLNGGNRRFFGSSTNTYARNSYFVAFGLTWSPNEIPISIR